MPFVRYVAYFVHEHPFEVRPIPLNSRMTPAESIRQMRRTLAAAPYSDTSQTQPTFTPIRAFAREENNMELNSPTLSTLFEQLGLDSDQASIDAFVSAHPLPDDVKLIDADFWTPQQARFLKEELRVDAEWAPVVDELNELLHPQK
jgi:hypothetical protein